MFTLFVCRREVQKKYIKSRRDSKSWRITTNLSGEKNRKRASPQETVILMKQTFEPFPLLSSTVNFKKGSQRSMNYKLPGGLLHRNQTALSDRLSHVSPVMGSVHCHEFWLSCTSICEWFISCLITILDFFLNKYTFQLCWWCKLNERLANVMQKEAVSSHYFLLAYNSCFVLQILFGHTFTTVGNKFWAWPWLKQII